MDLTDDIEAAEAAENEAYRQKLAEGYLAREAAKVVYKAAREKVRAAEQKERERAKKAKEDIAVLAREAVFLHGALERSSECESLLMTNFVPLDLRKARDIARARSAVLTKKVRDAEGILNELQRTLDNRDPKTVWGVKLDSNGQALRHPPDPSNPHAVPERVYGNVPNPAKWNSKAERENFMTHYDAAALRVSEAQVEALAAQKLADDAEADVQAAFEAAVNGR